MSATVDTRPGARPRAARRGDWQEPVALWVTVALVLILVLPPVIMLVYGSLRTADPGVAGALSFKPYTYFLKPKILHSALNTLYLALGGASLATVSGTVLAFVLYRTDTPGSTLLTGLVTASFYIPSFVSAAGWSLLASPNAGAVNRFARYLWPGFPGVNIYTMAGMIWVMGLIYTPYVILLLRGPFLSMDPSLEEAAWTAGAGTWRTVRRITLPLVTYSLISGFLVTFIQAAGNFGVPGVLGLPARQYVLATEVWNLVSFYPADYNTAAALAVLLMLITSAAVLVQRSLVNRREYTTITGKGYRPRPIPLGRWRWPAAAACWLYCLISIVLPLAVLGYASLLRVWSLDADMRRLSLTNYHAVLFEHPLIPRAFKNTAILSLGGATIGILLAALVAYFTVRKRWRGQRWLDLLASLPLAIPGLCIGVGLMWTYISLPIGIYGTIWILVLSFVTHYLPHGVRAVAANMIQIDASLEESAWVAGVGWGRTFVRVILPLVRPGMIAGWLVLVVAFFRELSSAMLLYTPENEVLSVSIWDLYTNGQWGMLSALSILTLALIFAIYGIAVWLTRNSDSVTASSS